MFAQTPGNTDGGGSSQDGGVIAELRPQKDVQRAVQRASRSDIVQ